MMMMMMMMMTIVSTHYTYPGRDGQAEFAWLAWRRYAPERSAVSVLSRLDVE